MRSLLIGTPRSWLLLASACLIGLLPSCIRRDLVFVEEDSPVRLADDCYGHVVYLKDGEMLISDESVHLHEGWWVVPPSFMRGAVPPPTH